jgi:hypothetical protein
LAASLFEPSRPRPKLIVSLDPRHVLSVNDLGGVYNTNLIESYCYLSPYALRPLLNLVKKWGKARSIASQYVSHPPRPPAPSWQRD